MADHGHELRIFTRHPDKIQKEWIENKAAVWKGDLIDGPTISSFVKDARVLFHLAGEINDPRRMYASHIDGTQNLINAVGGRGIHWVQLSSTGVYGPVHDGVVTERSEFQPKGVYELTKSLSDRLVIDHARKNGFTYTILRPSIVYGPHMKNRSLLQWISIIERGLFFFIGIPGASANFVHVDNVVDALVLCMRSKAHNRVYNLSDHTTLETFVSHICDELNRPYPKIRLPETPVRLCARILGKIPGFPLTESRVDALTNRTEYAIEKIKSELGYRHKVSMEEGLRQMVRFWKGQRIQEAAEG